MNESRFKQSETGLIPEDWEVKELEKLTLLITDGKHGDCQNQDGSGFYFLSAKDVIKGKLNYSNARQITEEDFLEANKRTNLEIGDVLLSNSGTIGRLAVAENKEKTRRTTFQKSVAIIKPNKELLDSYFLYYYFLAHNRRVQETALGTTQKNLLLRDLRSFKVASPSLSFQQKQISHLKLIDAKIELNQRMNETLEAVGQAVFRRWFVDFEFPDEEGKPYKSSGGKMVYNDELDKEIPENWTIAKLGKAVQFLRGVSYRSSDLSDSENALVSLKAIERGGGFNIEGLKAYTGTFKEEQVVNSGDIVIAHTDLTQKAEVLGKPAMIRKVPKFKTLIASMDLGIVRPKEKKNRSYFYYLLKSSSFQNHIVGYSNGTTVLHLSNRGVVEYVFPMPPNEIMDRFTKMVNCFLNKIEQNALESETLTQLRDILLPKLMSGKIRVPVSVEGVV